MVKRIGFWKEHTKNELDSSLLDETMLDYGDEMVKIISYLRSGNMVAASPGLLNCSLCEDNSIAGSFSVRTDGTWVWPDYYSHYIERHNLVLNSDFVEMMRTNNYKVPQLSTNKIREVSNQLMDSQGKSVKGGNSNQGFLEKIISFFTNR